jgi:hypothetical protein
MQAKKIWLVVLVVTALSGAAAAGWVVLRPLGVTEAPGGCTLAQTHHGMAGAGCQGCGHDDCGKGDCGNSDCDKGECGGCGHGKDGHDDADKSGGSDGDTSGSGDKPKDQKVIYTCPMHPEVQSHEPGKCPECGMNLEPQKEAK